MPNEVSDLQQGKNRKNSGLELGMDEALKKILRDAIAISRDERQGPTSMDLLAVSREGEP